VFSCVFNFVFWHVCHGLVCACVLCMCARDIVYVCARHRYRASWSKRRSSFRRGFPAQVQRVVVCVAPRARTHARTNTNTPTHIHSRIHARAHTHTLTHTRTLTYTNRSLHRAHCKRRLQLRGRGMGMQACILKQSVNSDLHSELY